MNTTKCTCGNCPKIREERGLLPFCQLPPPATRAREGFETYEQAAAARQPHQRIRSVGGILKGFPVGFVLV